MFFYFRFYLIPRHPGEVKCFFYLIPRHALPDPRLEMVIVVCVVRHLPLHLPIDDRDYDDNDQDGNDDDYDYDDNDHDGDDDDHDYDDNDQDGDDDNLGHLALLPPKQGEEKASPPSRSLCWLVPGCHDGHGDGEYDGTNSFTSRE